MKKLLVLSMLIIAGCATNNEPLDAIINAETTLKEAIDMGFAESSPNNYDKTQKLITKAKILNSRNKIRDAKETADKANRLAEDFIIHIERYQRQRDRN